MPLKRAWFIVALLGVLPWAPRAAGSEAPPDLWFPVGESLKYCIYWGVVPVGHSWVKSEWVEKNGRRLIAIRFRTKTNKVLSKLFPVDDMLETLVEPETFLPVRFSKKLSEGRYRCDEVTDFDHQRRIARWRSRLNGNRKELEIDPDTRDVISFMYYMRSKELKPQVESHYKVMADEKIYDLYVKTGKVASFNLPGFGRVPSLKIEPEAAFQGLFVRKGRVVLWVSHDTRRILMRMSARVAVGSVRLVLTEVSGPGNDAWQGRKAPDEDGVTE